MADTIEARVREIIREYFDCKAEEVNPSALLAKNLGLRSLDFMELVHTLQNEFDIDISDEDGGMLALGTFGDLVRYIERRIEGGVQ